MNSRASPNGIIVAARSASRWAQFVGLFMAQVTGRDIAIGRTLRFPKGSLVAIDRGYNDYAWYKQLNDKDIYFVTRIKKDAAYRVVGRVAVLKSKGLTSDQRIMFTGAKTSRQCPIPLRRIGYRDAETGKHYVFLTHIDENGKTQTAFTYYADCNSIRNNVRPLIWYKLHVVAGAKEGGLPADYIEKIEAEKADIDLNRDREKNEMALHDWSSQLL